MDIGQKALELHKKHGGKIETAIKIPVETKEDLSLAYTPGVGAVSKYIAEHKDEVGDFTWRKNLVAVVSDGSAVLGLGNIGPEGAYPVMEGKCLLFKRFASIDAVPIVLATQDPDEIIKVVTQIAPSFGGINLEDIAAPKCFYIEEKLKELVDIPVIHDDQWGTSVVVLAGLINAAKAADKDLKTAKIVVNGAGSAGSAIIKILVEYGCTNIISCDRSGINYAGRLSNSPEKELIASMTNKQNSTGDLHSACKDADILVGVSSAGAFTSQMISAMASKSIVFALANPTPEIMPDMAREAGAYIIATGRSDFPNQINNSLSFPGVFRGALDNKVRKITLPMLIAAAQNLASLVENPTPEFIIPDVFNQAVVPVVASAINN